MSNSNELINYIEKVKKVIDKIKQIELFFKEINNEEQYGGGETKLQKYKKEILKLREKKKKYLLELDMYKDKIKELSIQNQIFNQKISQLSFANYVNSTEKNNLIDKLDFFNKSLDILQGSILTNVNVGNELLEKFNDKSNINQDKKVSNVNITVKAEDLYKEKGLEINLDGGQNANFLPIIDNIDKINNQLMPINSQQVGGDFGRFQRVNKISQISTELKNKITLMSNITQGVKKIIENIVRVVNDQGNQNSLLNIRIKFEWLINRFKEVYEENEETKKLLDVLQQVRDGLGENISNIGVFENLLKKIETDTKGFVSGVEDISKTVPEKEVIDNAINTRAEDNTPNKQLGGSNMNKLLNAIENGNTDIDKLIKFLQFGGNDDFKKYTNYNDITKWLSFYANIKKWSDKFCYTFNTIRTNFFMILETLDFFTKTYSTKNIPEELNPFIEFCSILEDSLLILEWKDKDYSEFFKDDFITYSKTDEKRIINKDLNDETTLDFMKFMIGILVNNNNNTPDELNLNDNLQKIININNNLNELLYSYNFIRNLQYAFKQKDILPKMVVESQQLQDELKKLLYQTELYKSQSEYLEVKVELIRRIYQKLYWDPLEVFLKIYDNLDTELQKDIDIIENNFKLFILGMKYSSNQSQDHATFFKINLRKDTDEIVVGSLDHVNTFKYIIMLKSALYKPENSSFLDSILTGASDEKITKDIIIDFAGYKADEVPTIKVIKFQLGGNYYQLGGENFTNVYLKDAFKTLIDKITVLDKQNLIDLENFDKIKNLNDIEAFKMDIEKYICDFKNIITESLSKTSPGDKLSIYLNLLLSLFEFIINDVNASEKGGEYSPLSNLQDEDKELIEKFSSMNISNASTILSDFDSKINTKSDEFSKLLLKIYKQKFADRLEELNEPTTDTPVSAPSIATVIVPTTSQSSIVQKNTIKEDYLLISKTNIINGNRSKISDINDMLDKFIDGLKYDSFNKIKDNLVTYTTEINNRRTNGVFANFTMSNDTIKNKIISIEDYKTLETEKTFIKLILENIDHINRDNIMLKYQEILEEQLLDKKNSMITLDSDIHKLKEQKDKLKDEINILSRNIKNTKTLSEKNIKIEERKPKINEFIGLMNKIKLESRKNIKFLNTKALLLNFIEFMKNLKVLYADNHIEDVLKEKIIQLLKDLTTDTEVNFNNGKIELKNNIRKLINTGEDDPEFIKKFNVIKKLNTQLIYTVDKIISESLNAITVLIKARKEGDTESERYSYDKTCVTVINKKGEKERFGQFKNIFWSDKTISDLYCGSNVNCDENVPLTNSVRDIIEKRSLSNSFITYGASGSGKTTLLFGRGDSKIEGDVKGIITRIIEDILGSTEISESGEFLEIECMIGEIYGEKMNLSLLDNRYVECLYVWNLSAETPSEKMYIQDFSNESSNIELNNFNKKLSFLQKIKSSQYISNDRIFDISVLDKAKIWRSKHNMNNQFTPELNKYLNLKDYKKTEQANYDNIYRLIGSNDDDDNRTLYNIVTDADSYKKWRSEKIYNKKGITEYGKKLSEELENIINKIQVQRRIKNRVRCTKYNPDSSRSHMYIVVRLIDKVTGKYRYYNFIDKAGSEIPYEIAADEFVRLAEDPDDNNINFYTIKYNVDKYITQDLGSQEKNRKALSNKLLGNLSEIQQFSKGKFINDSTMTFNDNENPKIMLIFSENYKMEITTRIVNVSDIKINKIITNEGSRIDIGIKELELSFNIKIIESGVSREFDPIIIKYDVLSNKQLDIKLNYLLKLLTESNQIVTDKDKLLIKNIIQNVKKCRIKKNMQQLLFSSKYNLSSNIQDEINMINHKISELTDNLIKIIEYFDNNASTNLGLTINLANILVPYENIDQTQFNFNDSNLELKNSNVNNKYIFLEYNLNDLVSLNDLSEIKINLNNPTMFNQLDKQFKINRCRLTNNDLTNDVLDNLKLLYSYLHLLLKDTEGKKYTNKINIMIKDIDSLNENIKKSNVKIMPEEDVNFSSIITILKPEGYEYILNCIEEGITLMNRLFILIDLNYEITNHIKDDNIFKISAFDKLPLQNHNDIETGIKEVNKYKNDYEKSFFNLLFEKVIEKSYSSTVDKTIPDTEKLGIDYRNILASYYVQRGYFANLKQGAIGCNSPSIIEASNLIIETIKFLFDDVENNSIIKSILNKKFIGRTEQFPINQDSKVVKINKNDIFETETTLKDNINLWISNAEGNKPETLANLAPFLLALQFDASHFKKIKTLQFRNFDENDIENFSFYVELVDNSINIDVIIKCITNLIKRLYLISKLNEIFRFLDLITFNPTGNEDGDKKILDIYSNISLMSYFDDILWSDNDKITYMIEYEKMFNFKILFDLFEKQKDTIKYNELKESKQIWIKDDCAKYGSLWKDVANKIIPIYLLNVRQGFWINHSIRFLMRTIMYTSDALWIDHPLFDVDTQTINESLAYLGPQPPIGMGKEETINLLMPSIQLLGDFVNKYIDKKEILTSEIFSNVQTLENIYLAKYDIQKSPWLKLLGTLHHLGSNIHPTDISVKQPLSTGKKKESNKTWNKEDMVSFFLKLNQQYLKGTSAIEKNDSCKEFIDKLYEDTKLPNVFSFKDKNFYNIIGEYRNYLNPPTLETVKQLRLPWIERILKKDEELTIKQTFKSKDTFKELFQYWLYDGENKIKHITMSDINNINQKISKHNEFLKQENLDKNIIENEINSYKEDVKIFEDKIKKAKFNEIPDRFKIFNSQSGGKNYLIHQKGGEPDFDQAIIEELKKLKDSPKEKGFDPQNSINSKLFEKLNEQLMQDKYNNIAYLLDDILKGPNRSLDTGSPGGIVYNTRDKIVTLIKNLKTKVEEFNNKIVQLDTNITLQSTLEQITDDIKFFNEISSISDLYKKVKLEIIDKYIDHAIESFKTTNASASEELKELKAKFPNIVATKNKVLFDIIFTLNINEIKTGLGKTDLEITKLKKNIFNREEIADINQIDEKYKEFIIPIKNKCTSIEELLNNIILNLDKILNDYGKKGNNSQKNTDELDSLKINIKLKIIDIYDFYISKLSETPINENMDNIENANKLIEDVYNEMVIIKNKISTLSEEIITSDDSINSKIESYKQNVTKMFLAIETKRNSIKKLKTEFETKNSAKIQELNDKLTNELNVKNLLNLSFNQIKFYNEQYKKEDILQNIFQDIPDFNPPNNPNYFRELNPTELQTINITENDVLDEVLNIIIEKIRRYISDNGTFPNKTLELTKFNDLVKDINVNIKDIVYKKLVVNNINILSKDGYTNVSPLVEKFSKEVYVDGITGFFDLQKKLKIAEDKLISIDADIKKTITDNGASLTKTFTQGTEINASIQDYIPDYKYYLKGAATTAQNVKIITNIASQIKDKKLLEEKKEFTNLKDSYNSKIGIYNSIFKSIPAEPVKPGSRKGTPAPAQPKNLKDLTEAEINKMDENIKILSNIYYIQKFKTTQTQSFITSNEDRGVTEIIDDILSTINIDRAKELIDPLASLRLNIPIVIDETVDIEKLKLSKQVKSSEVSVNTVFSISSSRTLLLALSTRPDKVELVRNTLFFAMLLSKITNPSCEKEIEVDVEVNQQGGNIFKKYNIINNNFNKYSKENNTKLKLKQLGGDINNIINNNLKENVIDTFTHKKYKLINTMTGGSKKIIYLDEINEETDNNHKSYKIVNKK